jgi:hypothetical protein
MYSRSVERVSNFVLIFPDPPEIVPAIFILYRVPKTSSLVIVKKVLLSRRFLCAQRTLIVAVCGVSVFGMAACAGKNASEQVRAVNQQHSIVLDEIEEMYVEAFRVRDEMERSSRTLDQLIPILYQFDQVLRRHGILADEARQRVSELGPGYRTRSIEFRALLSERDMVANGYRAVGRVLADLEPPQQYYGEMIDQMLSR